MTVADLGLRWLSQPLVQQTTAVGAISNTYPFLHTVSLPPANLDNGRVPYKAAAIMCATVK